MEIKKALAAKKIQERVRARIADRRNRSGLDRGDFIDHERLRHAQAKDNRARRRNILDERRFTTALEAQLMEVEGPLFHDEM